MEAKKKAKQLILKFKKNIPNWDYRYDCEDYVSQVLKAKGSAIECVDEILESLENQKLYWQEVRINISTIKNV